MNKGRDLANLFLGHKDAEGQRDQFFIRTGLSPDLYKLADEEIKNVNESVRTTTFPGAFGASLRPFLVREHVNWLKAHDWKVLFSPVGMYHMRHAFKDGNRRIYRNWFFRFCLWSKDVHSRSCSVDATYKWEKQISVLLAEAERIFPLRVFTMCNHYLVHIPAGTFV